MEKTAPNMDAAGFAIPAVPVPQDLRAIMEMIGEAPQDVPVETATSPGGEESIDQAEVQDHQGEEDVPSSSKPMTAARHAELLAQLTSFVDSPAAGNGDDYEIGYITEDSEEEDDEDMPGEMEGIDLAGLRALMEQKRVEEMRGEADAAKGPLATTEPVSESQDDTDSDTDDSSSHSDSDSDSSESSALPARLAQVDMLSDADLDDDESVPAPSGPLKTEHEILEEPVGTPPFERLAQGARVILAGVVISVVRDPKAAAWEEWKKAEYEREAVDEVKGAVEDEVKIEPKDEAKEKSDMKIEVRESDVKVDEISAKTEQSSNDVGEVKPEDAIEQVKQAEGQIEDGQVNIEVSVQRASEGDVKPRTEPMDTAEQPTTASEPAESSDFKQEQDTDLSPAGNAAAKRARNRNRGNRRTVNGKPQGPPAPKTSGTIVVQAERPPAGTVKGGTDRLDEDGWLLDGSVIVTEDGQAVAVVAEVFGPTTQPFYLLKLPPPPFPVPSLDHFTRGTKLYYPAEGDHAYVPVRMLKTDKRFRGTDASNLYDEELAEHEMEWSDDEEEQAAKRKMKADRRGKKALGEPSIGRRQPHFDMASTAGGSDDEMSVHYGGNADGDDRSEAGFSVASSSRSRRVPQSYGDLYDDRASVGYRESAGRGAARGRGGRGRGTTARPTSDRFGDAPATPQQAPQRNQDGGRQIGRGAGRGRGQGERGRGQGEHGRGRGQAARGSKPNTRRQDAPIRPPASANLPPRPRDLSPTSAHIARVTGEVQTPVQSAPQLQQQPQQPVYNGMMGMPSFGWNPQPAMGGTPGMPMGMPMMPMGMGMNMGMNMGNMFSTPFYMQTANGQAQAQTQQGAFNPAFMQQYQQVKEQYQQMVARYQSQQGQGQPPPGQGGS